MRHAFALLAAAALLGGAPTLLAGQQAGVAALEARALVRVRTTAGAHFWGTLVSRSADSLVLTTGVPDRLRPVATAGIDTLWVRRGSQAGPGAMIGGVALAGALAFLFYGMSEGGQVGAAEEGALTGAIAGTVLGAAVGFVVPRWVRVFP